VARSENVISVVRRIVLAPLAVALLLLSGTSGASAAPTIVSLGFDDGTATQYEHRALLSERGISATFYVNTAMLGRPGYMTWDDVATLAAEGHEIGGHTLGHARLAGLPAAQQQAEICDDRANLLARGYAAVSFAYPHGADDQSAQSTVESCGYRSARTTRGVDWPSCDVCAESLPPRSPFATRALQSNATASVADLQHAVTNAVSTRGAWLQLVFHDICDDCDFHGTPSATLATFLDWLNGEQAAGRIRLRTVAQVLAEPRADTTAPTVRLTAPAGRASIRRRSTIRVTASDDVGVTQVRFLVDGKLHATDTSAPYSAPAPRSRGKHRIIAEARDAAGNVTRSAPITVRVR
jgi:peptidoglycan/xylan/chitin deacetylase (PgdA/CDA1 family)